MDTMLVGAIGLVVLMVLIFTSIPVAFVFALISFIGLMILVGPEAALRVMGTHITFGQTSTYTLSVIPLFMLMGTLAGMGGMVADAFIAARNWIGRLPGGLALATTAAAIVFGAVSGSSYATIITMTKVAWPEMKKYGYDPAIALGACMATGGVDNLIPPSIVLIFFALLSGESVARLFMGGIMPGLLVAGLMMVSIAIICQIKPSLAPPAPSSPWREKFRSIGPVWSMAVLIVVVLGGIWAGIVTPNEAAGVGAAGAIIIGLAKRTLNLKIIWNTVVDAAIFTSAILVMFISLGAFNAFMSLSRLPQELAAWVISMDLSKGTVVTVMVIVYVILGIPLEAGPIMMLTVPIFLTLLQAMNIDLVWFGILTTISMGLAGISPPLGNPMFIVHGLVKHEGILLTTIFKGATFFCVPVLVSLVLILIFPDIATWLPNTMMQLKG